MCRMLLFFWICLAAGMVNGAGAAEMPWIKVAPEGKRFALESSEKPFLPWGFNYDRDDQGRLIEDYWETEWPTVQAHFAQMHRLGANVVRIHLQAAKFLLGPERVNEPALDRLGKLLDLAEESRLYLDLTGLGCYHKKDVPAWYDALSEAARWQVQARFWEAIASRCAGRSVVFCYDLMNEPIVPGGRLESGGWLAPAFAGKHFVQFLTLDSGARPRPIIAQRWLQQMTAAVRKHDRRHLITVGLIDWDLTQPGSFSGFAPEQVVPEVDFVSVHLYPTKGKVDELLKNLKHLPVRKPVLVEEMFPLRCSVEEFEQFVEGSRASVAGWLGFYWGKPPEALRQGKTLSEAITLSWLEFFQRQAHAGK